MSAKSVHAEASRQAPDAPVLETMVECRLCGQAVHEPNACKTENCPTAPAVTPFDADAGRPIAREARIAKVLSEAPESAQNCLSRAFSGAASPRAAIKGFCLVCVGYDRQEVKNCQSFACPLWKYRPFQTDGGGSVIDGGKLADAGDLASTNQGAR